MDNFDEIRLLRCGYERIEKTHLDLEELQCKYRKEFVDDVGTKYYIYIDKYKVFGQDPVYDFRCKLFQKGSQKPINMNFNFKWDIYEVEDYMEKLFATGLFGYYNPISLREE